MKSLNDIVYSYEDQASIYIAAGSIDDDTYKMYCWLWRNSVTRYSALHSEYEYAPIPFALVRYVVSGQANYRVNELVSCAIGQIQRYGRLLNTDELFILSYIQRVKG